MSKLTKALTAAAGNAGGDNLYVEDVFSTYLYEGTGSARAIDNGIPLSDEGGLVWLKSRSNADSHYLFDTVNGPEKTLSSNETAAGANYSAYWDFPSAGTEGFNLKAAPGNYSGWTMASWTFRKAEKFFDVVTYTGTGSTRTVAHNLGSVPAVIIVKRLDAAVGWPVYHKENGNTGLQYLNTTAAKATSSSVWGSTTPTSTEFTVGTNANNISGGQFVAYLFASDAGGFGDDGSESIIKCGSYTGNGSTNGPEIDLGFEPQWVLVKCVSGEFASGTDWQLLDSMRGMPVGGNEYGDQVLAPNTSAATAGSSGTWSRRLDPLATGFKVTDDNVPMNRSGHEHIYIAIRRPMKTPESGTEVFDVDFGNNVTSAGDKAFNSAITVDAVFYLLTGGGGQYVFDRMRGGDKSFGTASTAAESSGTFAELDTQTGINSDTVFNFTSRVAAAFKRATGFFDVVAYTGNGASSQAITHNLTVAPEFIIVKRRELAGDWICQVPYTASPQDYAIKLNTTDAAINFDDAWRDTAPTATNFTVGSWSYVNTNGGDYIAYLFATLAGVSKVGSYTGTGSNVDVDCGFSGGARFILIKRTDSTGDWYVWDSERGIVAGNDPYLLLNSTAAEVTSTDYIDPLSSGFTVTSSAPAALNASGGTYLFMAIS